MIVGKLLYAYKIENHLYFIDIIDDKYDMPTQDIENIAETSYEDDVELNEFVLAA